MAKRGVTQIIIKCPADGWHTRDLPYLPPGPGIDCRTCGARVDWVEVGR